MTRILAQRKRRRAAAVDLRGRIVEATEQLLVDTADERKVSIVAITEAVGCTAPSIYYYWPDKGALIREVCQRRYAQFTASQDTAAEGIADPVDALRARGLAYFDYGVAHPEHYRLLFMQRPDIAPEWPAGAGHSAPEGPAGAGQGPPEEAPDGASGLEDGLSHAGQGLPEEAAAGPGFAHLVEAVHACMESGRFVRHDTVTVAVALWGIVHGVTSLAISNPTVPRPLLRRALELSLDAACRGLADLPVDAHPSWRETS